MSKVSKAVKVWLIVAASLVLGGALIFGGAMMALNWSFLGFSTVKYETNSYDIEANFKDISIVTNTADIVFVPTEGVERMVVCSEHVKEKHFVKVIDRTLIIELEDTRKWYDYIGIGWGGGSKITVYMPAGEYGSLFVKSSTGKLELPEEFTFESIDVSKSTGNVTSRASASGLIKIKTSTGHITLENVSAGALDLRASTGNITATGIDCKGEMEVEVSTGKVELSDVICRTLDSEGDTGDILLRNVVAGGVLSIERSTGDVTFDGSDAAEMFIETDTGDVKGTLLSEKVFIVRTDTGKVDVPKSVVGGRCEIETDTGNIIITVK